MKHLLNSTALLTVITSEKNNSGAEFTAVSIKTGKEYTFKIDRKLYNNTWYNYVKVEREYQQYLYLGFYANGNLIIKGQINTTPASLAIAWILRQVEQQKFENLDKQIELYHLGNCVKCGKVLTDSISIKTGLGPVCRNS